MQRSAPAAARRDRPGSDDESLAADLRRRDERDASTRSPRTMPFCSTRPTSPSTRSCSASRSSWRRGGEQAPTPCGPSDAPTIGTAVKLVAPLRVYGAERVPRERWRWSSPRTTSAGSIRRRWERRARGRCTSWQRWKRIACPGSAQLMRSFGAFPVRRGESDRDAVRTMRQIVRDGNALGMFAEGTRQRERCAGRGSAWCRDGRDQRVRPADPGGDPREPHLADRELRARFGRLGRADDLRGAPARRARATRRRRSRSSASSTSSGSGSSSSTSSAARATPTPPR